MNSDTSLYESDAPINEGDPDEVPIRDRKVITQQYDLVVDSLMDQIKNGTVFLRPISERPSFQRRYVWTNTLASRLIESILLHVPIPPCYLSQNDDFELDVIDGQQRLFSIYRFLDNQYYLTGIEVMKELNGLRYHKIPPKLQRQLRTHTLRCILITNESHPDIKFDVFERLNTNTVPLNAQELRNCIYRGVLNDFLKDACTYAPWLTILRKKKPDKRMRDEELVLRFFAFWIHGIESYRTPQKHWLNDAAKAGRKYTHERIRELAETWKHAVDTSLVWFTPNECFRRPAADRSKAINRALFDLVMREAALAEPGSGMFTRVTMRTKYDEILSNTEFVDLINRAVDHKKRTLRRFELWDSIVGKALR